ncbi:MAG: hypothetical protein KIS79_11865, partial [Burkholderiales bacterium]|nr:hypothetical protein [Burkholderiales bacterium]
MKRSSSSIVAMALTTKASSVRIRTAQDQARGTALAGLREALDSYRAARWLFSPSLEMLHSPGGCLTMKTPASILRIPLHAVLVMIPVGAWFLAGFCDFMYLYHGQDSWARSAFQA